MSLYIPSTNIAPKFYLSHGCLGRWEMRWAMGDEVGECIFFTSFQREWNILTTSLWERLLFSHSNHMCILVLFLLPFLCRQKFWLLSTFRKQHFYTSHVIINIQYKRLKKNIYETPSSYFWGGRWRVRIFFLTFAGGGGAEEASEF